MSSGSSGPSNPPGEPSIAELELRFAEQPGSEAFLALCEAYLAQGRAMEAMVVCKKGIKANPELMAGQLLLVRILVAQKKFARARTEIDRIIAANETRADPYFVRAQLAFDMGENEAGIADLRATLDRNPRHQAAGRLWQQLGMAAPASGSAPLSRPSVPTSGFGGPSAPPGAPSSPASVSVGPAPSPSTTGGAAFPPGLPPGVGHPAAFPGTPSSGTAPTPSSAAFGQGYAPTAPYQPTPPRRRLAGEDELEALALEVANERPKRGRPLVTLLLLVGLVVFGGAFVAWRVLEKNRIEAIDKLMRSASTWFDQDKYRSYQKAAQAYEDVIDDYDANHGPALSRWAHTYAILWGEHGERDLETQLRATLDKARAEAPEDGHTVAAQGLYTLYAAPDRAAGARTALEALEVHASGRRDRAAPPDDSDITLGIALLYAGEYEAAFKTMQEARAYLTSSVRAKIWLGRAAHRAGHLSESQIAFQDALKDEPKHPGALLGLVQVQLERGRLDRAAQELVRFEDIQKEAPKDISTKDQALAYYARSELARSAGEEAEANAAYQFAVKLDPTNADFPFGLGRWLLEAQRPAEAREYLSQAATLEPDRYGILVELAEAEMFGRKFEAAAKHIEDALAKNPRFVPAKLAKARLMRRTRQADTEAYLDKILEDHPTAAIEVKLELGRLFRQQERFDEAQKILEDAIQAMGSAPRPIQADVLLSYGRMMEDRGEMGVALGSYEKAGELGKLESWYRLAAAARREGDASRLQKGCERYLSAGTNLRYSKNAKAICSPR